MPKPWRLTPMQPKKLTERQVQRAVLKVFLTHYPEGITFHVPNGGARDPVIAAILKADGVLAGVPDLFTIRPFSRLGLIEVKEETRGRISEDQHIFAERAKANGHFVFLVVDVEEAYKLVQIWKKQDKASRDALN